MANNWYDDRRGNQDEIYLRRGDDRTRDFGRGPDREDYRAGDDDAHRNDREMAFGNFNQRVSSRNYRGWGDDRDVHRNSNPWDRDFTAPNAYESSRFFDRGSYPAERLFYSKDRPSYAGRGPKGYRRSDERIREEVSEVLERDHYIDASEVEVDVRDGIVTLRGHIEDRRQKRMAEDAIENLSGVQDVRNELTIDKSFFQRAKEALLGGGTESISTTSKGDLIPEKPRH